MKFSLRYLVCFGLLVAACGSGEDSAEVPATLAIAETTTSTTSTTVATTLGLTTTINRVSVYEDDENADGLVIRSAVTAAPSTTVPKTTASTAPQSTAPKTTSAPTDNGNSTPAVTQSGGGTKAPSSLYRGLLGNYTLDQVFASSPVAKPTAAAGTLPLLGVGGTSPNRPAVVVKVDNSSRAHPHSGLNRADIVFEEEVEFGITRFAAVFHSTDTTVGPVRSGRSTDISFLNGFGTPALVYSGANTVIDQLLLNQTNVSNYSAARSSGYWRDKSRRAPSNLYTKTSSFSSVAPGGPPPAQFHYRPAGAASTQGVPASFFGVNYPANTTRWDWVGTQWLRKQRGKNHITDGVQVAASNVVVVAVESTGTGLFDSTGAPVPEYVFVGEGPAVVYTDGRRVDGTWTRPTLRDPAILHVNGRPILLTPGRTWVQVTSSGQYRPNG